MFKLNARRIGDVHQLWIRLARTGSSQYATLGTWFLYRRFSSKTARRLSQHCWNENETDERESGHGDQGLDRCSQTLWYRETVGGSWFAVAHSLVYLFATRCKPPNEEGVNR